jgi:hypothetical protein
VNHARGNGLEVTVKRSVQCSNYNTHEWSTVELGEGQIVSWRYHDSGAGKLEVLDILQVNIQKPNMSDESKQLENGIVQVMNMPRRIATELYKL